MTKKLVSINDLPADFADDVESLKLKGIAPGQLPDAELRHTNLRLSELVEWAAEMIEGYLEPMRRRIDDLEATAMKHKGTWLPDAEYHRGDFITYDGSGWVALEASKGMRPGPSASWKLCVKRGKDGKDAPTQRVAI
jgi:hypothetical protein